MRNLPAHDHASVKSISAHPTSSTMCENDSSERRVFRNAIAEVNSLPNCLSASLDAAQDFFGIKNWVDCVVINLFDIEQSDIENENRGMARTALARQLAMYLCHNLFGLNLTDTGKLYGRDRTTVSHACLKMETLRDDPIIDQFLNDFDQHVYRQNYRSDEIIEYDFRLTHAVSVITHALKQVLPANHEFIDISVQKLCDQFDHNAIGQYLCVKYLHLQTSDIATLFNVQRSAVSRHFNGIDYHSRHPVIRHFLEDVGIEIQHQFIVLRESHNP